MENRPDNPIHFALEHALNLPERSFKELSKNQFFNHFVRNVTRYKTLNDHDAFRDTVTLFGFICKGDISFREHQAQHKHHESQPREQREIQEVNLGDRDDNTTILIDAWRSVHVVVISVSQPSALTHAQLLKSLDTLIENFQALLGCTVDEQHKFRILCCIATLRNCRATSRYHLSNGKGANGQVTPCGDLWTPDWDEKAQTFNGDDCQSQLGNSSRRASLDLNGIVGESQDPALYTNRAVARLKLGLWEASIDDCNACLALSPKNKNLKAFYYLSHAQLALQQYEDALANALQAHKLCLEANDNNWSAVVSQVLKCKNEQWEAMGRRENEQLERDILQIITEKSSEAPAAESDTSVHVDRSRDWDKIKTALLAVFQLARETKWKNRVVPEWMIDEISFNVMVDPLITEGGKSYDRSTFNSILSSNAIDPLTRKPLALSDLRPNLALKQAVDEFLQNNGWVLDW